MCEVYIYYTELYSEIPKEAFPFDYIDDNDVGFYWVLPLKWTYKARH